MTLLDQIDKAIKEVDLQIERRRALLQAEVDTLKQKKDALNKARKIVTPELEDTLAALENAGIQLRS